MIYLIRHGQSEGNVEKRYCGRTDVMLSQQGRLQAAAAGKALKDMGIGRIYTSPLLRAKVTAEIISNATRAKVMTDESLREIDFGLFENMTWDEMRSKYPEETDKWIKSGSRYKFPDGESYGDVVRRISTFVQGLRENDAVVSHFGAMQSLLICLGAADYDSIWNYRISNCDIILLEQDRIIDIIKCSL